MITKTVMEVGAIAVGLLGIVYVFIANIGATSVERFGLFETGAPVLSVSANYCLVSSVKSSWLSAAASLLVYKYWSYHFLRYVFPQADSKD